MKRPASLGFTLIEIVVAVAIFGVIASIVAPGLSRFLEVRERLAEKHEQLLGLQKTFLFLSNDLRYAANRLAKDKYGESKKTTLMINQDGLIGLTALYPDVNLEGESVPRRLQWVLEDGLLKRVQYPVMDPDNDTRSMVQKLLTEVADVTIEVSHIVDGRDNTDDKWDETARLPDLVDITIELENGLEYRRVFTMMGADIQQIAAAGAGGNPVGSELLQGDDDRESAADSDEG